MNQEFDIPTTGVKINRLDEYRDIVFRYLSERNKYNDQTIKNGLFKTLEVLNYKMSLLDILNFNHHLSIFQINWILKMITYFGQCHPRVKETWLKYQKSLEPKKPSKKTQEENIEN